METLTEGLRGVWQRRRERRGRTGGAGGAGSKRSSSGQEESSECEATRRPKLRTKRLMFNSGTECPISLTCGRPGRSARPCWEQIRDQSFCVFLMGIRQHRSLETILMSIENSTANCDSSRVCFSIDCNGCGPGLTCQ